jgi:hypothetical protein
MKPPWDPIMSSGCDVPYWLRTQLGIIPRQYESCNLACVDHDRAYYEGGTEAERELADSALRDAVAPIVGEIWAAEWYNAIRIVGEKHWGTGRTWDGRTLWSGAE